MNQMKGPDQATQNVLIRDEKDKDYRVISDVTKSIAALAWLIFQAVAREYRTKGRLTACSAFFEIARRRKYIYEASW